MANCTDVELTTSFIEWARAHSVVLYRVKIGEVEVDLADPEAMFGAAEKARPGDDTNDRGQPRPRSYYEAAAQRRAAEELDDDE